MPRPPPGQRTIDQGKAQFFVGGSAGFAFKLGESFRLLPELSVVYPVFGSATGAGTDTIGGGVIFQGGLGFLFGG